MLPNLNSSAASSASSSSHSPVLPFGVHHHKSDPGFSLSCFGLPVSAAQSRVGSPTLQPVAVDPIAQWKSSADGMLSLSFDGSGFHYSSDEAIRRAVVKVEEDGDGGGILTNNTNININGGLPKKKKKNKGAPAKNLMAERRRRRKLNDKLLMLRSVVPNITKMDRVSILRDAIQYLEELTQKINRLENQLDPVQSPANSQSTSPPSSSVTQATPCFTPTLAKLPAEEISPISLPSPNGQPARIEVRANDGRGMSIHMFCSKSPGVLLSVTRALESVGLEIQKAVVSSFNGLVLDIYCAEQCKEGGRQCVYPEQIKALLLEAIGFSAP